jgi:hypothetical protein
MSGGAAVRRQTEPVAAPEPASRSRERFGDYLRGRRLSSEKSLEEISLVTRIPERSLRCLEQGEFEALPGDVFVRGFLRSYASCLDLDVVEVLRRYGACGLPAAPVASGAAVAPPAPASAAVDDAGEVGEVLVGGPASTERVDAPGDEGRSAGVARARTSPGRRRRRADATPRRRARRSARASAERPAAPQTFIPPVLIEAGVPHRVWLAVAVVILVIVAAAEMSLLMRRPGEAVTRSSPAASGAAGN